MRNDNRRYFIESSLSRVVLVLTFGFLLLAILDKDCRSAFIDSAQFGIYGLVAAAVPRLALTKFQSGTERQRR